MLHAGRVMAGGRGCVYAAAMRGTSALCLCCCLCAGDGAGAGAGLPVPGWPQPLAQVELPPPAWERSGGSLHALAPDGAVRWRRPLQPGAQLWPGPGGVLCADDRGLIWLDGDGAERQLPPLPSDVRPLGVDGAVAFFAQERGGWRLNGAPTHLALAEAPLGSPLATGATSLWLTRRHLVWWDGGTPVAHRHGLPVGLGWVLARDRGGAPVVLAPDRRAWAIPAYQSKADDERLGLPVEVEPTSDRMTRLRLALARGDWTTAERNAIGTAERAALALYAGAPPPPGADDLAPLPHDPGELCLPEPAWSSAVAPRARPLTTPVLPEARNVERPLAEAPTPWAEAEAPPLRNREGLVLGLRSWLVEDDGERTAAVCRDEGRVRWYSRWLSEDGSTVPGRSLVLEGGRLLIAEGDAHLLIFDAGTGAAELDLRPRRLPLLPGRTWPLPGGAVVLFPPGLDNRLGWLGADGSERDEFLPAPARWLLALPDGEIWLSLTDGRTLRGRSPGDWLLLSLPAALAAAREVRLVEGGVAAGGQRWVWAQPRR
jgi:hypothetical protein